MFEFKVDAAEIERINNKLKGELVPALQRGVQDLSVQTHAHIVEEVQGKLHSSRQQYLDALSYSQVDENTYLISLNREAWWIEDGIPNGTEMIDWLLRKGPKAKSGPKVSKSDGSIYRVIPFEHNKGATQQTPTQNELKETIRKEMKKRGIPYGPIEKDAQGMPKLGKLHSFNIMDKPLKTKEGVGQGWGEIGKPKVGYTGIPFLQGVTIYQSKVMKEGKESVQKQIMTFRVVSSKHKGTGRWVHPGFAPQKFLDEAFEWAKKEWDTKILPEVLRSVDV